jgi:hypothetical protein
MKFMPAINNTIYVNSSQCLRSAIRPSARNLFVTPDVAVLASWRSLNARVSGIKYRKTINMIGGQAANQKSGLQPWLVVLTSPLANTVAKR